MESNRWPKHLVFQRRGLNLAGAGRITGSMTYVGPLNGEVVEVFLAIPEQNWIDLRANLGSPFRLAHLKNLRN